MDTVLEVTIWNEKVGAVVWDKEKEIAVFEFFDSFSRLNWDIAPLVMPLEEVRKSDRIYHFPSHKGKTFKGLPGLLADSLPDDFGNLVIDEWLASKGLNPETFTPIERLCYIGKRGMGALEYEPVVHDKYLNESSIIEVSKLAKAAQEVLHSKEAFRAHLKDKDPAIQHILKVGTSAGGVKPKAIIAWNEKSGEVRSGQVQAPEGFGYWLLKFDGTQDGKIGDHPFGIGNIEYAYYKMALACGINMAECRLFHDGNQAHFMTKRFDRTDNGDRLHTQTLCAIAHFDRDEPHSYEQAFQVMRRLGLPYTDFEQLYRRMVFNVVCRNHDDHTKNHSFIMNTTGTWRLSPAYDLCYSFSDTGKWTRQHQMSLNNKRNDFSPADLLAVAGNMGIKSAKKIIAQIVDVASHWGDYAKEAGVKKEHSQMIKGNLRILK
ncbi:MAG: type II toxin-antitoxin system HipA family toxin [Prevotellaceae bacterium]|jgi:serine/threonine-protein kinase HipA|nr:type II toxin-antitoxin system HipA family toxin [Prevotellaceae bacterium]